MRREENERSQQDSNAASLGEISYTWRGYQFREKDEFGLGHPEFQVMAKQSKENVKHRVGRAMRMEDSKQPHCKVGQTSNLPSLTYENGTNICLLGEHGDCPL